MEDVLELYRKPYDPKYPVLCMDEAGKQLIAETRVPLPAEAGQPVRYDHEYERKGVCSYANASLPKRLPPGNNDGTTKKPRSTGPSPSPLPV